MPKKKNHEPKLLVNRSFRSNYYVSYGISWEEFEKAAIKNFGAEQFYLNVGDDPEKMGKGCVLTFWAEKVNQIFWIWTKYKDPSLLAHEVFHAVDEMLDSRGVVLTRASREIYGYEIEWLMNSILE